MSPYYHAFEIDIFGNRWFWFAAGAAILAFALGMRRFYRGRRKMRQRYNYLLQHLVHIALAVVFTILVMADSGAGIVQLCDNQLDRYEDPLWSLLKAGVIIVLAGLLAFVGLSAAGLAGCMVKMRYLDYAEKKRKSRAMDRAIDHAIERRKEQKTAKEPVVKSTKKAAINVDLTTMQVVNPAVVDANEQKRA